MEAHGATAGPTTTSTHRTRAQAVAGDFRPKASGRTRRAQAGRPGDRPTAHVTVDGDGESPGPPERQPLEGSSRLYCQHGPGARRREPGVGSQTALGHGGESPRPVARQPRGTAERAPGHGGESPGPVARQPRDTVERARGRWPDSPGARRREPGVGGQTAPGHGGASQQPSRRDEPQRHSTASDFPSLKCLCSSQNGV